MTVAEPAPQASVTLAAALQAHAAGLCPIPARADGSKAPRGTWERWQSERPSIEQLTHWFQGGHPGIGLVCGDISGNLEMLELEGVAVVEGVGRMVTRMAREAGIGHIIERLRHGYFETTPSDGIHWLYRVQGEAVPGNTKLARRNATPAELAIKPDDKVKTLIETRGEGGFTVIAPSHGATHPSGKPWVIGGGGLDTIPTLTSDERAALFAVCRELDKYQPEKITVQPVAPTKRLKAQRFDGGIIGDSWFDAVGEHLTATEDWRRLLERYGWRYLRDDRHGSQLYCRPGKDDGVGAWVKNDRLNVFSSSTPLDDAVKTTHDRLEVVAAYEHGGDRTAAARAIAESTGILDAWKRQRDAEAPTVVFQNNDTTTNEADGTFNLTEEFWNSRPSLRHIRQAAHARACCADAVLAAVIARAVCVIPPSVKLPPIVGGEASLNTITSIVSASGGGKTTSVNVARRLIPLEHRSDVVDGVSPGSGEGLIEAWLEMVPEEQPDGKVKQVKRQTKKAVFMFLDEGQSLLTLGERSGSTIMPLIRSAWAGEVLSTQNASQETRRRLGDHTYRFGMCMGFQLQYAAELIADGEGGTPQRVVFLNATDPTIPDDAPEWPGPLELPLPADVQGVGTIIEVDEGIAKYIRGRVLARQRGQLTVDPLDTHGDLVKLKVAAVLAFLDGGRLAVTEDDWRLAGDIMKRSNLVRAWAIEVANQKRAREQKARNLVAADREVTVADTIETRALKSGARSIAKRTHAGGGIKIGEAHAAVASKHRRLATVPEMIDYAVAEGWVVATPEGLQPGKSMPA